VADWHTLHPRFAGASIVVTRPVGDGASLWRAIASAGGRAVVLPGLALRASDDVATRDALAAIGRDHIVVFSSPAAVRFAFALRPSLRIARGAAFAIGAGTARALARHDVRAVIPARADSEGLLALPELARLRGRRCVIVGAPGGRNAIAPALRRRGARVESVYVYRRVPARLTRRHFDALAAAPDPLLTLVSSAEALTNIVAALPAPLADRLKACTLVVSSERLAGIARGMGFAEIALARSAAPNDLLAAAEAALARHRL
jgi:uroporphyrinogen-III synthase